MTSWKGLTVVFFFTLCRFRGGSFPGAYHSPGNGLLVHVFMPVGHDFWCFGLLLLGFRALRVGQRRGFEVQLQTFRPLITPWAAGTLPDPFTADPALMKSVLRGANYRPAAEDG